MALTTLTAGSEVVVADLNNNFNFLQGEITNTGTGISELNSSLQTEIMSSVKITGDQTIGGTKTFSGTLVVNNQPTIKGNLVVQNGEPYIYLKNTNITNGVNPSENRFSGIYLNDSNNNPMGIVRYMKSSGGGVYTQMYCYDKNGANPQHIYVGYNNDGNLVTHAPACINTNAILTYGASSKTDGYAPFGTGLMLRWGTVTLSSGVATVTTTQYKSTSAFRAFAVVNSDSHHDYEVQVQITDKNKFRIWGESSWSCSWFTIGYVS